jgi:hypothetical protein
VPSCSGPADAATPTTWTFPSTPATSCSPRSKMTTGGHWSAACSAPLGELARQLLNRTHGRAAVARTHDQPWVFPEGPRSSALHRPTQGTPRAPGHPRPLRPQHRPHGPRRQAPARGTRPTARHPHRHRRSLGRTSRRLTRCLRRTGLPQVIIQHVLMPLVTNNQERGSPQGRLIADRDQ